MEYTADRSQIFLHVQTSMMSSSGQLSSTVHI